jgi:hypothetical protein
MNCASRDWSILAHNDLVFERPLAEAGKVGCRRSATNNRKWVFLILILTLRKRHNGGVDAAARYHSSIAG